MKLKLEYEEKEGWHIITSPQHPGLFCAGKDRDIVFKDVMPSLEMLILLNKGLIDSP